MSAIRERAVAEDSIFDLLPDELDRYPIGVITVDRSGRVIRYNRAESAFARRKPHDVVGRNFFRDIAPCAAVRAFEGRFERFAQGRDSGAEKFDFAFSFGWGSQDVGITLVRRADYDEIHIIVRVRSMRRPAPPAAPLAPAAAADEEPYELSSRMGHWVEEPERGIVWSDDLRAILGIDRGAAADGYLAFVHADDAGAVRAALEAARKSETPQRVDHRIVTPAGDVRYVQFQASSFAREPGEPRGMLGTLVDMTEQRRNAESWWRSAHYDALTGLPNRKLFMERLNDALERRDAPVALIFIDLDRFKLINDTAGHDVGDQLLRLAASRLLGCVRESDTVARLNGDEFVAMIRGMESHDAAADIAEVMVGAVAQPFVIDDREYYVTLSAGIALWPQDAADAETLLQAADMAMYHSKMRGPNGMLFYDMQIRDSTQRANVRESELRRAVNGDEFVLAYQPIYNVHGRLDALEALVRWNHPLLGVLPPLDFIPLAEKCGLIVALGAWVLRRACLQIREWLDAGYRVPRVTVNISPLQFKGRHFAEYVAQTLAETGVPANYLELELTESVIVDRFDDTLAALAELKTLGLRLAIDDFGTGYSALSYLKFLPVDTLKLDRAFVVGVGTESLDDAIAATIVTLAKNLKLDVVAEGVETERQLGALRQLGCTHVQGYHLARPMSAGDVASTFLRD